MSGRIEIPREALAAQDCSSDPAASAWVSANAGAGKTFVLAQRVVRLLLSGVPPRSILCLTYTTAAAAEMAQRVYDRLAALATMPEAKLCEEVKKLAPAADPAEAAARARTLFAETLETPGGLKVQTLHAFAAALLRRFPLEANVSGSFQVLDDATRSEMTARAVADVLGRGARDPHGPVARAVAELVPHVSDHSLGEAVAAVLAERRRLLWWIGRGADEDAERLDLDPAAVEADLRSALGLDDTPPPPPVIDEATCRRIIAACEAAGQSESVAEGLAAALGCEGEERERRWAAVFLTKDGEPKKLSRFVAKAVAAAVPGLLDMVAAEQERIAALRERRRAENAVAATVPLLVLGWEALRLLEAEKRRRGLIDYDDQIENAKNLVQTASAAAWVRFKLDEGIDHMMVDEAQDTSPPQWDLVAALTEEFFAGMGAREVARTLFVVGDEKQSIYSFQGAAPRLFAEKRDSYGARAQAAGLAFRSVELAHSFRSAPQVLAAVDRVFGTDTLARAVGAAPGAVRHVPIRQERGGVDVWPLFGDTPADKPEAWDAPYDQTPENAGIVKLVRAIADHVEAWTGAAGPDGGPPVRPGEILILSRKREPFATLMNRELKRRGIPSAGSDRLDVTAHIAVKDMMALARALISRDDLSLAAVLKSPLFGLDEEALFTLAHGRTGSLLAALADGDARARAAHATLTRWRRLARVARPFDFFAAILLGEGRRPDFSARMGEEAEDALDAFLDMALGFEGRGVPALETFLDRMTRTREELKRAADGRADAVRVMTVHGAKGLEAKVVFLADVGTRKAGGGRAPTLVPLAAEAPEWAGEVLLSAPTKEHRPQAVAHVLENRTQAESEEHYRLLYVGMTRAERHLVVCGSYGAKAPEDGMWHAIVREALKPDATPFDLAGEEALAWRRPEPGPFPAPPQERPVPTPEPAPAWLSAPAVLRRTGPEPLVPSEGEHVLVEGAAEGARRPLPAAEHGAIVHALLEREDSEAAMAERVRAAHPGLGQAEVTEIVAEARAVLALPELSAPVVRREVDAIGDVTVDGDVRRAVGRIDRLQIDGGRALVIDYKTDRIVPAHAGAAPLVYRRQLAVYRALAAAILPHLSVAAAIVWTARPAFMAMDGALPPVRAA